MLLGNKLKKKTDANCATYTIISKKACNNPNLHNRVTQRALILAFKTISQKNIRYLWHGHREILLFDWGCYYCCPRVRRRMAQFIHTRTHTPWQEHVCSTNRYRPLIQRDHMGYIFFPPLPRFSFWMCQCFFSPPCSLSSLCLLLQSRLLPRLGDNVRANVRAKDSESEEGGLKRELVKWEEEVWWEWKRKTDGVRKRQRCESEGRNGKNVMY